MPRGSHRRSQTLKSIFVTLDEMLPYVLAANQDFTPYYLARGRNHAEAIDKAPRFRLALLQRLNEIKRVHGNHGVLDVPRVQPFGDHRTANPGISTARQAPYVRTGPPLPLPTTLETSFRPSSVRCFLQ